MPPSKPWITPGTLCSVIGCAAPAVFEGEGLLHVGNRRFEEFKGALCQQHVDDDFVMKPPEWERSLLKARR